MIRSSYLILELLLRLSMKRYIATIWYILCKIRNGIIFLSLKVIQRLEIQIKHHCSKSLQIDLKYLHKIHLSLLNGSFKVCLQIKYRQGIKYFCISRTGGHCPSSWDIQVFHSFCSASLVGWYLQGSLLKTIIICYNTHQDLKISQCGSKQTKQYSWCRKFLHKW